MFFTNDEFERMAFFLFSFFFLFFFFFGAEVAGKHPVMCELPQGCDLSKQIHPVLHQIRITPF